MQTHSTLSTSDVTACIGFFLTLTGLIGTFFYVHLSNWLREILELKSKYDLNSVGDQEQRKEGRLECKFQLRRLFNHIPALISLVISLLIVALTCLSLKLIHEISPEPVVASYYKTAGLYFLIAYFSLTIYMLIHGYLVAFGLKKHLK
jgi:hypothetical protein